jgi:hypothetical protein
MDRHEPQLNEGLGLSEALGLLLYNSIPHAIDQGPRTEITGATQKRPRQPDCHQVVGGVSMRGVSLHPFGQRPRQGTRGRLAR